MTGASGGNFVISAATPTLSVTNSPQTYTGSAIPAVVSCLGGGTVSNVKYNNSSTVPSAVASYAITADCAASANYSAVTGASGGNFVISQATQTMTFANPGTKNFGTTPILSATATSSLPVTFSSSTTGVCTITSGGLLAFVTTGACTIDANQAGNGSYLAATTVTQSFTVAAVVPGAPTIGTATRGDGQASVTFTAPSFNGGSTITGYTVTSNPAGGTDSNAASTSLSHVVTGLTNGTAYTFSVTATNTIGTGSASAASNSVTPAPLPTVNLNSASRSISATTVTITGTGFDTTAANNTVTFNLGAVGTVTAATSNQLTVTFTTLPTSIGSLTAIVTTNGQSSGSAVQVATAVAAPSVTSSTSDLALNAATLIIAGTGFDTTAANNTVTFNNGAAGTVTAATSTQLTVTFTSPPTSTGSLTAVVTSFGGISGSPVQVATAVLAPVDCVVSSWGAWSACSASCGGGTQSQTRTIVTPAANGGAACPALSQSQACNTQACNVPTLSITNSPQTYTGSPVAAIVTCSGGGAVGNLLYGGSSSPPTNAGTYSVTGDCAANGNYSAVTGALAGSFVISPATQSITAIATPSSINVNGTASLSSSGSSGTGAVTFAKISGPCTVSGTTLTGTGAGTCVVTATIAADNNYSQATSNPSSSAIVTVLQSQESGNTPGGTVNTSITGGGFVAGSTQFTAAINPPAGKTFPYGVFDFTAQTTPGGTVTVTITYPQPLPAGTQYLKSINGAWVDWTSRVSVSGSTVTLPLTDGQYGDTNPASGLITDPFGPAISSVTPSPQPVPTLSEWAKISMMFLMILTVGWYGRRLKQR